MGTKRILNDLSLNDKVSFKDSSYGVGVVLGYNKDIGKHLIGYNSSGKKHSGAFTNTGGHFVQNKDNKYVYSDKLKEFQHYYYADSTLELLNTEEGNEGYRLGDEVEVQFQANGTVCTKGAYWDGSTTRKAQVVGFTDTGDALLYMTSSDGPAYGMGFSPDINRLIDSKYDGKLDTSRSAFVNSGSISMSKTGKKQTIRKDTVNVMSTNKTDGTFFEMLKSDGKNAAYRVAANQMSSAAKTAILTMMKNKGQGNDRIEALSEMLDTDLGQSCISMLLGLGLKFAPGISEDPRVQRLSDEFRIGGIAQAGNVVVGIATDTLLPIVTNALANLPAEGEVKATDKKRVIETLPPAIEEHEETKTEAKTLTA